MASSVPSRVLLSIRPSSSPGLLASAAAVAGVFAATPFVVAEAIDHYGIGTGPAALLSTAQVGSFMLANFYGGRLLHPTTRLVRVCLILLSMVNAASAMAPTFSLLATTRFAAGFPMGLLVWVAWSTTASDGRSKGEVAAMGPLAAALATPLVGVATQFSGLAGTYLLLAGFTSACLLAPIDVRAFRPRGVRNPIGAPIVRLVLLSLFLTSAAGSSVFVFTRVIADQRLALSTLATAVGLSINAVAGIPSARFAGRRRVPGLWMLVIAGCAVALATVGSSVVFFAVMFLWGMSFWLAVPEAFSIMADRSIYPGDRVGDAHAVMSLGRVVGPSLGAATVSAGGFPLLGWVAACLIVVAACAVEYVATEHRWR